MCNDMLIGKVIHELLIKKDTTSLIAKVVVHLYGSYKWILFVHALVSLFIPLTHTRVVPVNNKTSHGMIDAHYAGYDSFLRAISFRTGEDKETSFLPPKVLVIVEISKGSILISRPRKLCSNINTLITMPYTNFLIYVSHLLLLHVFLLLLCVFSLLLIRAISLIFHISQL